MKLYNLKYRRNGSSWTTLSKISEDRANDETASLSIDLSERFWPWSVTHKPGDILVWSEENLDVKITEA